MRSGKQWLGDYGVLAPLPAIGGSEGVGCVAALGDGVTELAVGQLVLLPRGSGTWVTHLLAEARSLVPLSEGPTRCSWRC